MTLRSPFENTSDGGLVPKFVNKAALDRSWANIFSSLLLTKILRRSQSNDVTATRLWVSYDNFCSVVSFPRKTEKRVTRGKLTFWNYEIATTLELSVKLNNKKLKSAENWWLWWVNSWRSINHCRWTTCVNKRSYDVQWDARVMRARNCQTWYRKRRLDRIVRVYVCLVHFSGHSEQHLSVGRQKKYFSRQCLSKYRAV